MNIVLQHLCTIQAKLFRLASKQEYNSEEFILAYMNSELGWRFNSTYDRVQWMGEESMLCELVKEYPLSKGNSYSEDVMFWIGYLYFYWHVCCDEECKEIVKIAPPRLALARYTGYHTISMDLTISDFYQSFYAKKYAHKAIEKEILKKYPLYTFPSKKGKEQIIYSNINYLKVRVDASSKLNLKEKSKYFYWLEYLKRIVNKKQILTENQYLALISLEKFILEN